MLAIGIALWLLGLGAILIGASLVLKIRSQLGQAVQGLDLVLLQLDKASEERARALGSQVATERSNQGILDILDSERKSAHKQRPV